MKKLRKKIVSKKGSLTAYGGITCGNPCPCNPNVLASNQTKQMIINS